MFQCFKAVSNVQKACTGLHVAMVDKFAMLTLLTTVNSHTQQLRHTTLLHIRT